MNYIFEREFAVTSCILCGESDYILLNILEKRVLLYSWTNNNINVSESKLYMTCMNISEFLSTFPVCHAFVFIKRYDFHFSVYIPRIVVNCYMMYLIHWASKETSLLQVMLTKIHAIKINNIWTQIIVNTP